MIPFLRQIHRSLEEVNRVIKEPLKRWLFQKFPRSPALRMMSTITIVITKMSSVRFFKYEGAGNDFIFIDVRAKNALKKVLSAAGVSSSSQLAKKLCTRNEAVGADGLVLIQRSIECDFGWDFYNSDGSHAEMCGN